MKTQTICFHAVYLYIFFFLASIFEAEFMKKYVLATKSENILCTKHYLM